MHNMAKTREPLLEGTTQYSWPPQLDGLFFKKIFSVLKAADLN